MKTTFLLLAAILVIMLSPSIANAIFDATGLEIKELPITPDKVLFALEGKRGGVR